MYVLFSISPLTVKYDQGSRLWSVYTIEWMQIWLWSLQQDMPILKLNILLVTSPADSLAAQFPLKCDATCFRVSVFLIQ